METLSGKNLSQKRAGGVAQGIGPEFKPKYHNNNKKKLSFYGSARHSPASRTVLRSDTAVQWPYLGGFFGSARNGSLPC
jgi:hypothetical protein